MAGAAVGERDRAVAHFPYRHSKPNRNPEFAQRRLEHLMQAHARHGYERWGLAPEHVHLRHLANLDAVRAHHVDHRVVL